MRDSKVNAFVPNPRTTRKRISDESLTSLGYPFVHGYMLWLDNDLTIETINRSRYCILSKRRNSSPCFSDRCGTIGWWVKVFKTKTVFVIGAGASFEAGMPLGVRLLSNISERLNGFSKNGFQGADDLYFEQAIQSLGINFTRVMHMLSGLSIAMKTAFSIDNFLQARSHDKDVVKLGKILIADSIISAERSSTMAGMASGDAQIYHTDNWYRKFFNTLVSGVYVENLERIFDNVSIISFNYDRCIKEYLFNALQLYFGIDEHRSRMVMENLNVIHPYGSLGRLSWEYAHDEPFRQPFGGTNSNLIHVSNQIYTFDESISNIDNVKTDINKQILSANKIIFLGFAYYEQNMKLLTDCQKIDAAQIFGTAYNISTPSRDNIVANMMKAFNYTVSPNLSQKECWKFFDEYDGLLN